MWYYKVTALNNTWEWFPKQLPSGKEGTFNKDPEFVPFSAPENQNMEDNNECQAPWDTRLSI
jgi:hypothetical protein